MMNRRWVFLLLFLSAAAAMAQIKVEPAVVNVNAQGASTVFLSYGSIRADQFSVEAIWCADLVPAAPDIGFKCNPASTWGRLPLRNDLARPSGTGGFTDIMTIPPNVARRAYQRAASGPESHFYYVRRFGSSTGQRDEYIPIICRLSGRGSKTPLAITDVKLAFASNKNVLSTPVGQAPPPLHADLTYSGTGRLIGRWEVVLPGAEPPTPFDLVPEASLPVEQRSTQKRFTQLSRFNVHLPPTGTYRLEGPDVSKLPATVEGLYQVLLRVEASDDGEGNTDLGAVGSGTGIVTSGGVAGFSFPVLRYYVGAAGANLERSDRNKLMLVSPSIEAVIATGTVIELEWSSSVTAAFYRVDVSDSSGTTIVSAIVAAPTTKYRLPLLDGERKAEGKLLWSIVALSEDGSEIVRSPVASFRYGVADEGNP